MKLLYKILITGKLTVETGMHIGGSEVELEIGGIDNAVIKESASGVPYIPGSSLKGKLRDLIAKNEGYRSIDEDINEVFVLFGDGASNNHRNNGHLIVRDSFYDGDTPFDHKMHLEEKSENTINRLTGAAKPRHIERVVKGTSFKIEMILDVMEKYKVRNEVVVHEKNNHKNYVPKYKDSELHYETKLLVKLKKGFKLLEQDYLGGSGTRGYGKVKLEFEKPNLIEFKNEDGSVKITPYEFDFN